MDQSSSSTLEAFYSEPLRTAVAGVTAPERRTLIMRYLSAKVRRPDTYEIFVILFGAVGLSLLYVGRPLYALARSLLALATGASLLAAFVQLSALWAGVGFALTLVAVALWMRDWLTVDREVDRYYGRVEAHVIERLAR